MEWQLEMSMQANYPYVFHNNTYSFIHSGWSPGSVADYGSFAIHFTRARICWFWFSSTNSVCLILSAERHLKFKKRMKSANQQCHYLKDWTRGTESSCSDIGWVGSFCIKEFSCLCLEMVINAPATSHFCCAYVWLYNRHKVYSSPLLFFCSARKFPLMWNFNKSCKEIFGVFFLLNV